MPTTTTSGLSRWWTLAVISTAQLMVVLDSSVMNVALPRAQADLGFDVVGRQWVIASYSLAFGALLLVGGRLGDVIGRRRAFLIGLVGFGAASVLGGLAPDTSLLIAARALQGVFGALLAPAALTLLTTTFPSGPDRAKAFGVFGAVAGAGGAVGLLLGGALTELVGWRWTLLINIIFTVAAVALGSRTLPAPQRRTDRARIDVAGAVLVSAALAALVLSMSAAEITGWASLPTIGLLIVAVVLGVVFVALEARRPDPLLPLGVVANRLRGGALLSYSVAITAQLGIFLLLSYFFQERLGFTPLQTGLAFMPLTIAILVGATQIGPRLAGRVSYRATIGGGFLVAAIGLGLVTRLTPDLAGFWTFVIPGTILVGLGSGVAITRAQSAATSDVEPRHAGVASALVNVSAQIGTAVGTALLTALQTTFTDTAPSGADAGLRGYVLSFVVAAGVMALAAVLAFTTVREHTHSEKTRTPDRVAAS